MAINQLEIRDSWLKIAARLQRMGKTQHVNKCKLIRINILVSEDGDPMWWPEPECLPIEPGNGAREWLNRL
jgi:hypothetical protein